MMTMSYLDACGWPSRHLSSGPQCHAGLLLLKQLVKLTEVGILYNQKNKIIRLYKINSDILVNFFSQIDVGMRFLFLHFIPNFTQKGVKYGQIYS